MRFITGLLWFVISFFTFGKTPECVMFFYSSQAVPDDLLYAYDWVVLPPENKTLSLLKYKFYMRKRAKLIAYVSVGERTQKGKYRVLGKNTVWNTYVMDLKDEDYIKELKKEIKLLLKQGYDGVFLDTLDSYRPYVKPKDWREYEKILEEIVLSIKKEFPDKLVVLNRGFGIAERLSGYVDGVVVESLFKGIKGVEDYTDVPPEDRKWLLEKISVLKEKGIPVVIVDYLPPNRKKEARKVAERIRELGFIPFVSDSKLSGYGISLCNPLPRKIILLYDSSLEPEVHYADIHRLFQMPLEYLGFVPMVYDVRKELPVVSPEGGFAGVISMHIGTPTKELEEWLIKAKKSGLKIFFVENLPLNSEEALREFGIERKPLSAQFQRVTLVRGGGGYEAPYVPKVGALLVKVKGEILTELSVSGEVHTPFVLTEWGGIALDNSLVNNEGLWIHNPFEILKRIFGEITPTPDITTENGRRILTVHIDGDGFFGSSEVKPGKTTAEVIKEEILERYPIPHTVSVIEAELAPWGINPDKAEHLEKIAREIFKLPFVEPASHSFSHPFTWNLEARGEKKLIYGYNLPVKGYKLDFEREIKGSIKYVNERLLKGINKEVKVFLWTGYCNPTEEHLKMVYGEKVLNVNGGDTTITKGKPFLKHISPMGVNLGHLFQVYAPIQNENVFTNEWTHPLWGYIKVIQTFKMTGKPIRLKPISIYYHFYSGEKFASLNALKKVYDFALSQEVTPIYLSEYALRVLDYRETAIIRRGKGFIIKNAGYLRTLRIPASLGFPDIEKSKGIVGFKREGDFIYIHLDGSGKYTLLFTDKKPKFALVSSNGIVEDFQKEGNKYRIKLKAYTELEVLWEGKCKVFFNGRRVFNEKVRLKGVKYGEIEAVCTN